MIFGVTLQNHFYISLSKCAQSTHVVRIIVEAPQIKFLLLVKLLHAPGACTALDTAIFPSLFLNRIGSEGWWLVCRWSEAVVPVQARSMT